MKYYLFFFITLNFFYKIPAQTFICAGLPYSSSNHGIRCVYSDTTNNLLYIGGNLLINNLGNKNILLRYNGTDWDTVPGVFNNTINTIMFHNDYLYVGGFFSEVDGINVNGIAKFDGLNWYPVISGFFVDSITSGVVNNIKVINDTLFAMGIFRYSSNPSILLNGLSKLDNSNWLPVYDLPNLWDDNTLNIIADIELYNNELYVGGNFCNDSLSDIIKFNGHNWKDVNFGIHGGISAIQKVIVYQGKLIVGGLIYKNAGNVGNFIQAWDGNIWKEMGGSLYNSSDDNAQVHDLKIWDTELYVAGVFDIAGNIPASRIVKWDGERWCGFGGNFNNRIVSVDFYSDTMFVACGMLFNNDTVNWLAKWTGGNYVDTCSTVGINEVVYENESIHIFPNPANTSLTVNVNKSKLQTTKSETTYRIIDKLGREVKTGLINSYPYTVPVYELREGMYIIIVQGWAFVEQRKFVKEN